MGNKEEEVRTKNIIDHFRSQYGFELKPVCRKNDNYEQYKYDIEVLHNDKPVAIIEAKMRLAKGYPATDAIIASMFKAAYERKNKFYNSVQVFLLFYINSDDMKINDWSTYKNNVLMNLNSLLCEQVDIKPIYINILEDVERQIEDLDKELNNFVGKI